MSRVKQLPQPEESVEILYLSRLGIISYDKDNLYPQNVRRIIRASKTGSGCLERYADFLEGDGIQNLELAELVINRNGDTLDNLHHLASDDLATYNGFALHVNYDETGAIIEINHVPFENVRLCDADSTGRIAQVAICPDWEGKRIINGKRIKVERENIDYIDVFNPIPAVVRAQIERVGGIDKYKGQVLYVSAAGNMRYPLAFFDAVITDLSTDEGLSNLMLRNARNNFIPAGVFVHYRGQGTPENDFEDEFNTEDYSADLQRLQGDRNALNLMDLTVDSKEEIPEFISLRGNNIDKDFTATDASVKEAIYSKFGQEAFLALRNGKVGFSGSLIADATDDYSRRCAKMQRMLTRAYIKILSHWSARYPLPAEPNSETLAVIPISYAVKSVENI